MHESQFEVIPAGNSCNVGRGPVATMSLIVFLWILFSLIYFVTDKSVLNMPVKSFDFLLHYPLTSLWISQPRPRRLALISQLCACELLMLALIGAFMNYFDAPTQNSNAEFKDYYGWQLSRGAAAWAMTQAFTIPIFLLNAYTLLYKKTHIYTIPACVLIILLSVGAIIAMTTQYCSGYTQYWIINFLIFLLLDITTLQVIYAIIASLIIKSTSNTHEKVPSSNINTPRNEKAHKSEVSSGARTQRIAEPNNPENNASEYEIIYTP